MSTALTPPQAAPPAKLNPDGTAMKPWYQREFYAGRAVKLDELMNFSRQLSAFLTAGIPILDSLEIVGQEGASKKMQEVISDVARRLRAGSNFGGEFHPATQESRATGSALASGAPDTADRSRTRPGLWAPSARGLRARCARELPMAGGARHRGGRDPPPAHHRGRPARRR